MKFLVNKYFPFFDLIFAFILYLFVNLIFVYKYGSRQDFINVNYLLLFYAIIVVFFIALSHKTAFTEKSSKYLFALITFFVFLITIVANMFVDGYSLNVDRWSAMSSTINGWLSGEYPYTMPTHLGGRSSNLPFLLIIGLPFYLLGDVGFLQSGTFLLFSFLLHISLKSSKAKLLGIGLLALSTSFMWEVYAKSDLMSNFVILLSFIVIYFKKFGNENISKPITFGSIASLLFLTRLVTAIPLTLLFFKGFLKSTWRVRILFVVAFLLVSSILIAMVLINYPTFDILFRYNPILLQNRQLPLFISVVTLIIPFYYSFRIKSINHLLWYSFLLLLLPVIVGFNLYIYNYGFNEVIHMSKFDISYFNIFMPFTIFFIANRYDSIMNRI
jgi:hypothetical protein